jgi:hypothetical protein
MMLFVRSGFGQQTQATLTGLVSDPSGAALPGAEVTITNVDTAIARTIPTNAAGRYTVTNLNPGNYSVTVKATGFSEKVEKGIVLAVGQQGALDVGLTPGGASDVVTVSAAAAVTDTETSSQGTVIDNQEVVGLPLNQRTFYGLALLSPAAYMPGQNSTLGFRGGFNVAGNEETANTFTVNGIDDNDQDVMAPSFRPSVEAIQEFKLLTGVYPAEYGRTSGGQVVVITKTGTNSLHGDVFEFIRNSQFDAKNYFTVPNTGTTLIRNQFGGTVGGPIVKDKTFFFLSYEGMRLKQPVAGNTTVPNPAFLNGDFSSVCNATAGFVAGTCTTASKQLVNPVTKVPYANNQIGTLSPEGLALLKLYPAPNPGQNLATTPNPAYTFDEERFENLNEGSARVDHKISDKDSLLVQYNYFVDPAFEPSNTLCSSALIPGFGCYTDQISELAGVNWTHILNDHWLNELRFGWDRLEQPRIGQDVANAAANAAGLGSVAFHDSTISSSINGGAPATTVSGYASIHPYTNLPQHRYDNHYNLVDNISWSHGKHNVKFGVNMLQARYSVIFVSDGTGVLGFTGGQYETSGNPMADLALGYASSSARVPTAPDFHPAYSSYSGYIQDDWKVTPSLTLNVGMRYEYFAPLFDKYNLMSNYLLPSGFTHTASNTSGGTIIVAGQSGTGKKLYNADLNNFAPRFGLAFQPFGNEKTVLHASYGIFYNAPSIGNGSGTDLSLNLPFRLSQTFTSPTSLSACGGVVGTCAAQVQIDSNPFPSTGSTPNGTLALPYQSISPYGIDQNFRTMYDNQYGADIQRQVTSSLAITVGYMGNTGRKLPRPVYPNQAVVTGVTTSTAAATLGLPNGTTSFKPLSSGTVGPVPNPLGTGGAYPMYYVMANPTVFVSEGSGNFNAMTVKAQQNYKNGFSFILAFTWSHSLDNTPGYASTSNASSGTAQNNWNLAAEYGTSDFNVKDRLVISPVYELPFGKGKPFLTHGVAGLLTGGWQLSGIFSYDTGRPFTIYTSSNRSGSVYGQDRPDLIGNPNSGPKKVTQWFNTAAFAPNAYGQFGNEARNAVLGPNYDNTDVAIQRMFDVTERYKLAFRAEAFDVFNKPNFFNPFGTSTGEFVQTAATSLADTPGQNGNSLFGQLTQANDPRSMQFSLKILF